jgi:hypothetical protein
LGIGIAFRKRALQSIGGFNPGLQVFEYLDLSLRSAGLKGVKTPDMTVLHLEPERRFTLGGYLRRKVEYGFWYHSLFYLHPKRLTVFAFPIKLGFLIAMAGCSFIFLSYIPLLALLGAYVFWMGYHFRVFSRTGMVAYAASLFDGNARRSLALVAAVVVLTLGELAGDLGKLWGVLKGPRLKGVEPH